MPMAEHLLRFLLFGYVLTVAIEAPILLIGLSARYTMRRRVLAGCWLTACTYPIVVLVLPYVVWEPYGRTAYLAVAETFAPVAECAVFYFAFDRPEAAPRREAIRNATVITAANVASFLTGELLYAVGWL